MRVLCIGDVVGSPGRKVLRERLPDLISKHSIDLVIVNAENASGGVGLTSATAKSLLELPIDLLTGGNHIWRHKDLIPLLNKEKRLLRPLNYPEDTPGQGMTVCTAADGTRVGVITVMGRIFMEPVGCPFRAALKAAQELRSRAQVILVEIHAEATSEKRALGWFLAGKVSAVYGTHTHVPTADDEILPGGTGYLTDLGMTGPFDSVIGMRKEGILQRFLTQRPQPMTVAKDDLRLCGALFDIDEKQGKTRSVLRVQERLEA